MLPGKFALTKTRITVENALCACLRGVVSSSAANEVCRTFLRRNKERVSRAIHNATWASLHEGAS